MRGTILTGRALLSLLLIVGGAMILFGYRARIGGSLLAAFLVPVTLKMHPFWAVADPVEFALQRSMFMKNLALPGGALTFAYFVSGPFSVDRRDAVDERTPALGHAKSMAGTVILTALRRENEEQ